MCLGALLAGSNPKRRSSRSNSGTKRRNERPDLLRHEKILASPQLPKSASLERPSLKRPRELHGGVDNRVHPSCSYNTSESRRPRLDVKVPAMWHRPIASVGSNSSEEMLLNHRSARTTHDTRHYHVRYSSQSTLRGRGAKRHRATDPHCENPAFSSTSRRAPKRTELQTVGEGTSHGYQATLQHQRRGSDNERSRHHFHRHSSARPNTSARRDPDRRFAVLAATNTALEHLRREAFAQPSPPPRRERLRRYQGVTIPASRIPFEWDCISSWNSTRYVEPSSWQRQRQRQRR